MKRVTLAITPEQCAQLRRIAESVETPPRVAKRAQIILIAAHQTGALKQTVSRPLSDHGIAARIGVCADTVRSTIRRFTEAGLESAVYDKPFVRKVTPEAEEQLLSLVQSQPPPGSSRWTLELLATKMRDLRFVESISDTGVWDILQKRGIRIERGGAPQHTPSNCD